MFGTRRTYCTVNNIFLWARSESDTVVPLVDSVSISDRDLWTLLDDLLVDLSRLELDRFGSDSFFLLLLSSFPVPWCKLPGGAECLCCFFLA